MTIKLEDLIEPYGKMISIICHRMIQDEEKARDAAQEVWMNIAASLPSFRGESKISTWIYSIAYRITASCWKNEKCYSRKFLRDYFRGEERFVPDYQEHRKREWIKEMCDKCLTGTLHCLDNDSRMAYILKDVVGLSYEELVKVLPENDVNLRKKISRSRKKLKSFLTDECALFNPDGNCHCRMKKLVIEIDLPQEYKKIKETAKEVDLFEKAGQLLPTKNYWEKFM